ncbi:MAG: hypothetical protein GVY33_15380 [Alphaproteobacteria bacterium]|jgi:aminoglycoside phosphotransferase family enzyme|nr:hypothetical protein [Alphaproteobacteria bacterium]
MAERTSATEETLAFLRRAEGHPEDTAGVEVVETHFAWVFLGTRVVRKLRKPIRTPRFDLTTVASREAASREEVRLNRVLAPDVYLGVEPLTRRADGGLALDGEGPTVDWLVVMRRLPAARALDVVNPPGPAALEPLADLLAGYYARAPRVAGPPASWAARIAAALDELQARLAGGLAGGAALAAGLAAFAGRERALLETRAAAGRIVDGHGDLRPEHVYLTRPPRVLDRLDFDAELRRMDWLEDLALLAVDLERLGRPWIAAALTDALAERLDDAPPPVLGRFYRAWRALLRARLCLDHRARPGRLGAAGWLRRAKTYLAIAERHALRLW